MSQPQRCNKCNFNDGRYMNFGDNPILTRMYHGNFTCPKCGAERITTLEEVKKDLRDIYEERGENVEDQHWWKY